MTYSQAVCFALALLIVVSSLNSSVHADRDNPEAPLNWTIQGRSGVWPRCYLTNSYYHEWGTCPFGGYFSGGFGGLGSKGSSFAGVHYQNVWRSAENAWLCCP